MNRAYSLLTIKSFDDDKRIVTGIATTPQADLMDDVVEPKGAEFKLPIPFLWQHNSSKPVGHVTKAKVTSAGIEVEVHLRKTDEPGTVKDRLDEAWQDIKLGLVRGLSIGFKGIETAQIEGSFGVRFLKWLWLELSAVTIAANTEASIQVVKSIDAAVLAATGHRHSGNDRTSAGASATRSTPVVKAMEAKSMSKKTIAEQISAFEATRQAKAAELDAIMDASAESGETLSAEQKENYDTLDVEVKEIDEHLVRLRAREKSNLQAAKPANGGSQEQASESRGGDPIRVSMKANAPPGAAFIRKFLSVYNGKLHGIHPADFFKSVPHWQNTPEVEMVLRAPVASGTTLGTTWAAPLVVAENMASEFAELLRPLTIIGRIPGISRVPFNIKIPRETTGASVGWVGEGAVKPVSAMAFDQITMLFNKVAGIVPITEELLRFSSPAAEGLIRDSLTKGIAQFLDRDFLDPTKAAVTGVSPASVTNGVTPITATGSTADALRADLGSLLAVYTAANANLSGLVLIMTSTQAMRIAFMRNTLGNREFEGLVRDGGSLEGIPVIVSENIVATGGSPTDGGLIVAINAPEILLADDGGVDVDVSREASLQMNTAPDSPETASTVLVSLWQRNLVAVKAERFITWSKRRTEAVQFIQNAKYA